MVRRGFTLLEVLLALALLGAGFTLSVRVHSSLQSLQTAARNQYIAHGLPAQLQTYLRAQAFEASVPSALWAVYTKGGTLNTNEVNQPASVLPAWELFPAGNTPAPTAQPGTHIFWVGLVPLNSAEHAASGIAANAYWVPLHASIHAGGPAGPELLSYPVAKELQP